MPSCPECFAEYADEVKVCPEHGVDLVPTDLLVPTDPPLEPGTMVGEYRVDKKLGAGTFGDVYAGEQPVIGKRVAIKVLNRRFASEPVIVSRFVAEARAVNRIRQRNIIDIFSFGVLPVIDRHYFVMELLDGMTLGELLDRTGSLPVALLLPIVQGIAEGLDAAHDAGITHRDLKPDNVFLARERDGTYLPKLLDFGIAKLAGQEVAHKTSSGMVLGTPRYMSPEQARGKPTDHRADIYALGVMIHEMLTGHLLFDAESAVDMLLKHAAEDPPRMSMAAPTLPAGLDAPVLAMLAKRPADRPNSAGAAIRDLTVRAKELGLDRATTTIDGLLADSRAAAPAAVHFSGTTAIVSEPVVGRDGEHGRGSPSPSDGGPTKRSGDVGSGSGSGPPFALASARELAPTVSAPSEPLVTPMPRFGTKISRSDDAVSSRTGPTTESVATIETPSAAIRKSRLRFASIAAIAVVGGSVALAAFFIRSNARVARDTPAVTALPPPPPVAASVSLMVWSKPADVEIWHGASRLGTSSSPLQLARGSAPVELHLRKEGFTDTTVTVVPDHDQGVDAALEAIVLAPPPKASASVAPVVRAPGAQPAAGKLDRILGGRD